MDHIDDWDGVLFRRAGKRIRVRHSGADAEVDHRAKQSQGNERAQNHQVLRPFGALCDARFFHFVSCCHLPSVCAKG